MTASYYVLKKELKKYNLDFHKNTGIFFNNISAWLDESKVPQFNCNQVNLQDSL